MDKSVSSIFANLSLEENKITVKCFTIETLIVSLVYTLGASFS